MSKQTKTKQSNAADLFTRADKFDEQGNFKAAFRLFRSAVKLGDKSCELNLANYYTDGKGVRRNLVKGMYWYKRAFRRGEAAAANNIGITWRNEGKSQRALSWFKKAVKLGDDEANLEIARYYLADVNNLVKAIKHLEKVCESTSVTEAGAEEATKLLKQTKKRLNQSGKAS